MLATTSNWTTFRVSSTENKKVPVSDEKSSGTILEWMVFGASATISLPQTSTAAGSVSETMPVKFYGGPVELDEIDAEIARMSDEEIVAAVLASAGMWADREDLDFILDRSDRIDELYASDTPDTDPSI